MRGERRTVTRLPLKLSLSSAAGLHNSSGGMTHRLLKIRQRVHASSKPPVCTLHGRQLGRWTPQRVGEGVKWGGRRLTPVAPHRGGVVSGPVDHVDETPRAGDTADPAARELVVLRDEVGRGGPGEFVVGERAEIPVKRLA